MGIDKNSHSKDLKYICVFLSVSSIEFTNELIVGNPGEIEIFGLQSMFLKIAFHVSQKA